MKRKDSASQINLENNVYVIYPFKHIFSFRETLDSFKLTNAAVDSIAWPLTFGRSEYPIFEKKLRFQVSRIHIFQTISK